MKKKALFLSAASLFMLSGCAEIDKFLDDFVPTFQNMFRYKVFAIDRYRVSVNVVAVICTHYAGYTLTCF